MTNIKFLPVDEMKFRTLILKKGYQLSELSTIIGHSNNYLKLSLDRHSGLTVPATILIKHLTGISYEDYRPDDKIPERKAINDEDSIGDTNALLREINHKLELLIGAQVKVFGHIDDGIEGQTAIIHLMERLEDTIFKAVDKAWRQ